MEVARSEAAASCKTHDELLVQRDRDCSYERRRAIEAVAAREEASAARDAAKAEAQRANGRAGAATQARDALDRKLVSMQRSVAAAATATVEARAATTQAREATARADGEKARADGEAVCASQAVQQALAEAARADQATARCAQLDEQVAELQEQAVELARHGRYVLGLEQRSESRSTLQQEVGLVEGKARVPSRVFEGSGEGGRAVWSSRVHKHLTAVLKGRGEDAAGAQQIARALAAADAELPERLVQTAEFEPHMLQARFYLVYLVPIWSIRSDLSARPPCRVGHRVDSPRTTGCAPHLTPTNSHPPGGSCCRRFDPEPLDGADVRAHLGQVDGVVSRTAPPASDADGVQRHLFQEERLVA